MKATQPSQYTQTFQQEAQDYNLQASLNKSSLTITLKVYDQCSIYHATYTEDSIGKEIHRKIDLEDIYYSLFLPSLRNQTGGPSNGEKHGVGQVMKIQNIPCFKIQPHGRLIVYKSIDDRYLKKNVIYESILSLKKLSEISQSQLIIKKFQKEKKDMILKFQNEINNLKQERQSLIKSFYQAQIKLQSQIEVLNGLVQQMQSFKKRIQDEKNEERIRQQSKIVGLEYKIDLLFRILQEHGIVTLQNDDESSEESEIHFQSRTLQVTRCSDIIDIRNRRSPSAPQDQKPLSILLSSETLKINFQATKGNPILMVQPNHEHNKIQQLKKSRKVFVDDKFPPSETSIFGQYPKDEILKGICWKKATEVFKNPQIFHQDISPRDISQGSLGDCYFLAAIAALAEKPQRIKNLFLTHKLNQHKYFSIRLLYRGKWITIHLDQYIPWLNNKLAFAQTKENELWVILLEKAWAKLYTSYKRITGGYSQEPLHDLTGAPTKYIDFEDSQFMKDRQWVYLLQASQKNYPMVGSTKSGSDKDKSAVNIVQGHAYTVLQFAEVTCDKTTERIVQCRNPWGQGISGQYTGKWSDFDKIWDKISPMQKRKLGYTGNKQDGIFFMPYDIFIKEFKSIFVAEVENNASYIYKSVKDPNCEGVYYEVVIFKQGLYSFQVDQTPERKYTKEQQSSFNYSRIDIKICKVMEGKCTQISQTDSDIKFLCLKQKLTPGKFIVFAKIQYDRKFETDFEVNLAIYSKKPCVLDLAKYQDALNSSKVLRLKKPTHPKEKK